MCLTNSEDWKEWKKRETYKEKGKVGRANSATSRWISKHVVKEKSVNREWRKREREREKERKGEVLLGPIL